MEVLFQQIQKRNDTEKAPFLEVHNSNTKLNYLVSKLRVKCQRLETECSHQQADLAKVRCIKMIDIPLKSKYIIKFSFIYSIHAHTRRHPRSY